MSAIPQNSSVSSITGLVPPTERRPIGLPRLAEMKAHGEPIVMITAYDYPSAQIVEEAGVDIVLVGDSAAMTALGYDSTVSISMTEMLTLAAAVRRGLHTPLLVGDMPFGSYQESDEQAIANAVRFVKEGGCDAVKLEGAGATVARVRVIVGAGIPVMGHVGLTPQTATMLGGYRAQGRTAAAAARLLEDALELQQAGCFALVFEAIPAPVTDEILPLLQIPVIGIGAGTSTDGQVLVFHDLLGLYGGHVARFAKRYADTRSTMLGGVREYAADVRDRSFPAPEHTYSIDPEELKELRRGLKEQGANPNVDSPPARPGR